ncbi:pyrroline-5-carboxylate reductase [Candidatus Thiosymbion oneisti]|uniref:pyrroline-5-carboxylate reductase n=2 Tax=Candidatus Thiosymbion oneisti TaxID=589554 RepID=UPI00311CDE6E
MPMLKETIAFIGGGNMAASLIAGLLTDRYDSRRLVVGDPDASKRDVLAARFGVRTTGDNAEAVDGADLVVLSVKPQLARRVCRELSPTLGQPRPLFVSVMAGIREQSIREWLGGGISLVRAMPNTPAMIQAGAIVLHATPETSPAQRNQAETVLRAGGLTRWVDQETQMDAVTALSGSGPAYFFLLMEILEQAGIGLGLESENARLLTIQTALGAARMAMESDDSPHALRERVTSPGGTTERALDILEAGGIRTLVTRAVNAACERSEELSRLLTDPP